MSELPSSEGLDPYPATDAPNPTTLSAAKSRFMATSPLVGIVATAASLRWGLGLLVAIGVATTIFAGRLDTPGGREAPADHG
ncbi:hypothetical protein [Brevibacterium casei]